MTDKIEDQIELWFYRDISDDQRKALIRLTMGEGCADEANNHSRQRSCLKHILAAHRIAGERAGMERAAGIAEDVGDAYVEPTQRDYDRREGCYDAAQAIRAPAGEPT